MQDGGKLAQIAVWNASLTQDDATAIYNSGNPKNLKKSGSYDTDRTSNLVGWWRFGDDNRYFGFAEGAESNAAAICPIMLDSTGTIGPNIVPDGDFNDGVSGWNLQSGKDITFEHINGNAMKLTQNDGNGGVVYTDAITVEGSTQYLVRWKQSGGTVESQNVRLYRDELSNMFTDGSLYFNEGVGEYGGEFKSGSTQTTLHFAIGGLGNGETLEIDYVYVQKVTGSLAKAINMTDQRVEDAP